jgi:two-component system response regulator VicR
MGTSEVKKEAKRKILVAEDDIFLKKILLTKLALKGFEAISAIDGEEALKQIIAVKPDLILLDLMMPKKNGFEVMEELNKNHPEIKAPIIILSNLGQESDVLRGKKLGAVDYLVKSNFSINAIIDKVNEYLK